jgi:hypothetical protein
LIKLAERNDDHNIAYDNAKGAAKKSNLIPVWSVDMSVWSFLCVRDSNKYCPRLLTAVRLFQPYFAIFLKHIIMPVCKFDHGYN